MEFFRVKDGRHFDSVKYLKKYNELQEMVLEKCDGLLQHIGAENISRNTWEHKELDILIHVSFIPRTVRELV